VKGEKPSNEQQYRHCDSKPKNRQDTSHEYALIISHLSAQGQNKKAQPPRNARFRQPVSMALTTSSL
jgi:hypothetical protein